MSIPAESSPARWRLFCWSLLAVFAASSAAAIVRVEPLLSANDTSRWATVRALVDEGTYRIDNVRTEPGWDTIDKVYHEEEDGKHFYSSKPPLLATLVAGVYWCAQKVTGWTLGDNTAETARAILLIVNWLPMLLALWVFFRLLERYARTDFTRYLLAFTLAAGTFLTTFLVTLNNHSIAGISVIFALYSTMRILADKNLSPLHFLSAGFFAAFTCTNELPAALFGVAVFGLLCYSHPKLTWLYFVPAALVPLSGYFLTNYIATGGIKPFYAYYGTEKYNYYLRGIPSYWIDPKGLDKAQDSPLTYFLHCTIGHHGIYSLSPIFLFTLLAWVQVRRWKDRNWNMLIWMGLALTVVVLGFYMTRTENYNYGGNTSGLRWMFWLIPFWLIALIPLFDAWADSRGVRIAAVLCLAVSTFSAVYPMQNPWRAPWLFTLMDRWEWIDYSDDPPPPLERKLVTWFASLPDPQLGPAWVEFVSVTDNGVPETLRLSMEPTSADTAEIRWLKVTWNRDTDRERIEWIPIDVAAFNEGVPPAEWRTDSGAPPAETGTVLTPTEAAPFLQGLPEPEPYRGLEVSYRLTSLRENAFQGQLASAEVEHQPAGQPRPFLFQTDLFLTPEIPFGVLRMRNTIASRSGGAYHLRRWEILGASSIGE